MSISFAGLPPAEGHRPGLELSLACVGLDLDAADDRVCLTGALTTLNDDEREHLAMRFIEGISSVSSASSVVSQMQVSRTLRRIIGHLRHGLLDETDGSAAAGWRTRLNALGTDTMWACQSLGNG